MQLKFAAVLLPVTLLACVPPENAAAGSGAETTNPGPPAAVASAKPMPVSLAPPVAVSDPAAPGPAATLCEASATPASDLRGVARSMRIGSGGGWCADTLTAAYRALDVATAPQHGTVVVHKLPAAHAVYYQPQPGYVGSDLIVFRIMPSAATLTMKVVVGP